MMLDFLLTWFWYLMAFAAGMFVAWLLAVRFVVARTPDEAIDVALSKDTADDVDTHHGGARTQAHARALEETS